MYRPTLIIEKSYDFTKLRYDVFLSISQHLYKMLSELWGSFPYIGKGPQNFYGFDDCILGKVMLSKG